MQQRNGVQEARRHHGVLIAMFWDIKEHIVLIAAVISFYI